MFEKLKTILKGKEAPKGKPQDQAPAKPDAKAPQKGASKPAAPEPSKAADSKPARPKAAAPKKAQTPEEMCGITPKMSKDEVRERLALLYRRYNRATSSLDAGLRAEAEEMLDAIVIVREKVFGPI